MNIIKEIIHNYLMSFSFVSSWAKKFHSTGMNDKPDAVNSTVDFYSQYSTVENKSILEIGPGQTLGVLKRALEMGAKNCTAIDVCRYYTEEEAKFLGLEYVIYDGEKMPFDDQKFDMVWSFDVFEHVRFPEIMMREIFRVLKPGGMLISRIDLRDHFFLNDKQNWLNCFQYSENLWRRMTYNRSNFINRLRKGEWESLARTEFREVWINSYTEESLLLKKGQIMNLDILSDEDIKTWQVDLVCKK